ncbi:MAG: universal stress protein [Spirulinaceae cyanobacterium]
MNNPQSPPTSATQEASSGFAKVLVALDPADEHPKALEQAIAFAEHHNSQLMIFACLPQQISWTNHQIMASRVDIYGGTYSQDIIEQSQKLATQAIEETLTWLHSLYTEACDRGVSAEFNYHIGEPGVRICAYAKTWGADLIIVGRRGYSGIQELLLGSISNYVLHHAHCSVLIVQ